MGFGGKPGPGRPKGSQNKATKAKELEKEQARELLRSMVKAQLGPMTEAQIANAKGIKYLMVREKGGKFVRVTEAMAGSLADEAIVEVWEKDPSVQAFTDLLNRTLDKPVESVQAVISGDLIFKWEKD